MTEKDPWFLVAQFKPRGPWQVCCSITSAQALLDAFGLLDLVHFPRIAIPAVDVGGSPENVRYEVLSGLGRVALCLPGMCWPQFMTGGRALAKINKVKELDRATSRKKGT